MCNWLWPVRWCCSNTNICGWCHKSLEQMWHVTMLYLSWSFFHLRAKSGPRETNCSNIFIISGCALLLLHVHAMLKYFGHHPKWLWWFAWLSHKIRLSAVFHSMSIILRKCHGFILFPSDQQQGLHSQDVLRAPALQRVCLAQKEAPEERWSSVSCCVMSHFLWECSQQIQRCSENTALPI